MASKVVHFSTHHIIGTVPDKRNGFLANCFWSFWKQRLGCDFYVAVKYFCKLAEDLIYRKVTTFYGVN